MGMSSELENYMKIAYCTCGKCECKVGDKIMKKVDEKRTSILEGVDRQILFKRT